jgi:transcriptional regulator with XRE-family HTH domain
MNPIETLRDELQRRFPEGSFNLTPPLVADGQWTLDISHQSRQVVVNWTPPQRFDISSVSASTPYGEGADEFYSTPDEARQRLLTLLSTEERTSPPVTALLSRIREDRGVTQSDLAKRLNVAQATVSGMERRKDIQISTLRRTVEALGGALRIVARFEDASYTVLMEATDSVPIGVENTPNVGPKKHGSRLSFPCLTRRGVLQHSQDISQRIQKRGGVFAPA